MGYFDGGTQAPTYAGSNPVKETFLQRQKRLYTQQGQRTDAQPQQPAAAPATASGSSPVGSDGRVTPTPPPQPQPAQPAIPPAAPAAAGSQVPQAHIPARPQVQAAPPAPELQQQTSDYASYLMANPHTMSDENLAQMQAQQREQAAIMARDAQGMRDASAAARGTYGGGQWEAGNRRASDALTASILGANRDLALKKMEQDRQDELAALGAGQDVLQSQWDTNMKDRQLGLQEQLGLGGLGMDQARLNEQGREYDLGQGLDIQKFFENQRQFNNDLGYKYSDLQQQQQNQLMNWLKGVYGAQ